jgi:hypothetical protein
MSEASSQETTRSLTPIVAEAGSEVWLQRNSTLLQAGVAARKRITVRIRVRMNMKFACAIIAGRRS